MTTLRPEIQRRRYHPQAYKFVFASLRHAQELFRRDHSDPRSGHVSGPELLEGIRDLALRHFGPITISVFRRWGVNATEDFGNIVFELVDAGEMRRTDDDQLSDFVGVYDFREAFVDSYEVDTSSAFSKQKS